VQLLIKPKIKERVQLLFDYDERAWPGQGANILGDLMGHVVQPGAGVIASPTRNEIMKGHPHFYFIFFSN
jgi:hypothetical protein